MTDQPTGGPLTVPTPTEGSPSSAEQSIDRGPGSAPSSVAAPLAFADRLTAALAVPVRPQTRARSNQASQVGTGCTRFLWLLRTRGHERPAFEEGLLRAMQEGSLHEAALRRQLSAGGFEVYEAEREYRDEVAQITCRIDGCVIDGDLRTGERYVLEVKSMSRHAWERIDSVQAMRESSIVHHQRYPAQMAVACHLTGWGRGIWLLKDRDLGRVRLLPYLLTDEIERLDLGPALARAVAVCEHLRDGTEPPAAPDTALWCERCDFRGWACFPEQGPAAKVALLSDAELLAALETREALAEQRAEWERADETAKATIRAAGKELVICGDYLCRVTVTKAGATRVTIKRKGANDE
jgi:hypothetical protein